MLCYVYGHFQINGLTLYGCKSITSFSHGKGRRRPFYIMRTRIRARIHRGFAFLLSVFSHPACWADAQVHFPVSEYQTAFSLQRGPLTHVSDRRTHVSDRATCTFSLSTANRQMHRFLQTGIPKNHTFPASFRQTEKDWKVLLHQSLQPGAGERPGALWLKG